MLAKRRGTNSARNCCPECLWKTGASLLIVDLIPEPSETIPSIAKYCATANPETQSDDAYAMCDDYYHSLPVVSCDTDTDCEEKNPQIAAGLNHHAY
jgi:hypothetical protein